MLTQFYTLYIPSTVDTDRKIDNTAIVEKYAAKLSSLFGGATITQGSGCWVRQDNGSLVIEPVSLVKSFCTSSDFEKFGAEVRTLALQLKIELTQEAVSLETPQGLDFIGL